MSALRKSVVYLKMSCRQLTSRPNLPGLWDVVRFFTSWWKHLAANRNSVSDRTPWLTFGAIQFIEKITRPDMVVFEYGSGGSTLFWADRVSKVVSVEHNREWYDRMSNEFRKPGVSNVEYLLVEADVEAVNSNKDPLDPKNYLSTERSFMGKILNNT